MNRLFSLGSDSWIISQGSVQVESMKRKLKTHTKSLSTEKSAWCQVLSITFSLVSGWNRQIKLKISTKKGKAMFWFCRQVGCWINIQFLKMKKEKLLSRKFTALSSPDLTKIVIANSNLRKLNTLLFLATLLLKQSIKKLRAVSLLFIELYNK